MESIRVTWSEFKTFIESTLLKNNIRSILYGDCCAVWVSSDGKVIELSSPLIVGSADYIEFTETYQALSNKESSVITSPFAAKTINGYKIYTRNMGVSYSVVASTPTNCDFLIPFDKTKVMGIEVVGAEIGDIADLQILDTPTGTLTTVPYYMLNEFATDLNIPKDYYSREAKYDADLIKDLTIRIIYNSTTTKNVRINYLLHELKA